MSRNAAAAHDIQGAQQNHGARSPRLFVGPHCTIINNFHSVSLPYINSDSRDTSEFRKQKTRALAVKKNCYARGWRKSCKISLMLRISHRWRKNCKISLMRYHIVALLIEVKCVSDFFSPFPTPPMAFHFNILCLCGCHNSQADVEVKISSTMLRLCRTRSSLDRTAILQLWTTRWNLQGYGFYGQLSILPL